MLTLVHTVGRGKPAILGSSWEQTFSGSEPILVQMLRTKLGAQMGTELVLCQGKKSAMKTIKE